MRTFLIEIQNINFIYLSEIEWLFSSSRFFCSIITKKNYLIARAENGKLGNNYLNFQSTLIRFLRDLISRVRFRSSKKRASDKWKAIFQTLISSEDVERRVNCVRNWEYESNLAAAIWWCCRIMINMVPLTLVELTLFSARFNLPSVQAGFPIMLSSWDLIQVPCFWK